MLFLPNLCVSQCITCFRLKYIFNEYCGRIHLFSYNYWKTQLLLCGCYSFIFICTAKRGAGTTQTDKKKLSFSSSSEDEVNADAVFSPAQPRSRRSLRARNK